MSTARSPAVQRFPFPAAASKVRARPRQRRQPSGRFPVAQTEPREPGQTWCWKGARECDRCGLSGMRRRGSTGPLPERRPHAYGNVRLVFSAKRADLVEIVQEIATSFIRLGHRDSNQQAVMLDQRQITVWGYSFERAQCLNFQHAHPREGLEIAPVVGVRSAIYEGESLVVEIVVVEVTRQSLKDLG